jgi:uncharacterized protein DUF6600
LIMKIRFNSPIIAAVSISLSLGAFSALADLEVSSAVQIHTKAEFHAPLAGHGTWVEVSSHGQCWRPANVAVSWRPYSFGHWVWTDFGWYWISDEPWAWACYHYGWWVYDPVYGWVWVPGIEWAPAWVSWRVGGGYIGWAPLPPPGIVLAPPLFAFVEIHRFHDPIKPSILVVNNTTIINKTAAITGIKHETRSVAGAASQRVVINEGPGVDLVEKATGKKLSTVPIREAVRQTTAPPQIRRANGDSPGKDKPSPDVGKRPSRDEFAPPPPERRREPAPPVGNPAAPSKGKSEGRGGGKGKS